MARQLVMTNVVEAKVFTVMAGYWRDRHADFEAIGHMQRWDAAPSA